MDIGMMHNQMAHNQMVHNQMMQNQMMQNGYIHGHNTGDVAADVSSVGDGIIFFGYKSSFLRTARSSCIGSIIGGVFLGIFSIVGIVLAICVSPIFWLFVVGLVIMWVGMIVCSLVNGYHRRETEIYMNSQTRLLIIKSQRTPFWGCFDADQENKEFSLDLVQSIDQTPIDVCCGEENRQVGFTVTLVTGESYSPIRPYFNHSDIGHLQEFLRNWQLGQFEVGPIPGVAAAAVAANAQAALWAYPPPYPYPPDMRPPQGYPAYPSIDGVGGPPPAYATVGRGLQGYYPPEDDIYQDV